MAHPLGATFDCISVDGKWIFGRIVGVAMRGIIRLCGALVATLLLCSYYFADRFSLTGNESEVTEEKAIVNDVPQLLIEGIEIEKRPKLVQYSLDGSRQISAGVIEKFRRWWYRRYFRLTPKRGRNYREAQPTTSEALRMLVILAIVALGFSQLARYTRKALLP